ncbi:MAG TPA: ATP-binding protein [Acidimicrobiales bacterium]|nr:ATP-binding protein [Acidimicrobiales bacterium]
MEFLVDLTLPTDARLISQTRRVVSGYLHEMGVATEVVDDVVLALDEACTNVMRHAFPGAPESFHLSARLDADEVVVIVEDDGVGLPTSTLNEPLGPSVPMATSGRGLQMIRRLMTDVELETAPLRQGTRLEMRRSLL